MSRRKPSLVRLVRVRALLALALLLTLVTCRDGAGPQLQYARVAVAPIFPSNAGLASFGLSIDRVRFVITRGVEVPDTLVDTTVALPPDARELDLNLRVPIASSRETVFVSIVAMAGAVRLFEGTAPVEVVSGGVSEPTEIPVVTYVGPGAGVDSIAISPRAPFLYFSDSLRFQVQAFQTGVPVPDFYVSWSTSDTVRAHINGIGSLRAPLSRTSVWVIARTPAGTADSVPATFQPVPSQLAVISGSGQSGPVSLPLATQLEVEVRGADNLPVTGVAVRFRSLSGGTPGDTIVTSDLAGRAQVIGALGPTPGLQSFAATLPAFPTVTAAAFNATAIGIVMSPATSILTVASGSVSSGNTVKLRLQGKDPSGTDIATGGDVVAFTRSGGASTGTISAAADSGNGVYTALFTGVLAGSATTIGATINGAPVTSTLPTIAVFPGAISPAASLITASSGIVVSGSTVTLRLQARDAAGNALTTGGDVVTFGFSGGASTGTISAAADSGNGVYTASFTGVLAGAATSIDATINDISVTTLKPTVTVTPGAPAQLVFVTTPAFAATGVVLAPAIEVAAHDLAGNATPGYAGVVTIAIGTNPVSGLLAGTLTQTASGGVATFGDLAIDLPGVGYTLIASAAGLASATTTAFDVVPPSGTIFWAAATSGNWSNPANWVGGLVPGPTETAAITVPGTYTVTLDVGDTIGGLQLGASSGVQTLLAASKTLHVSGTTQVNANGLLWLKASTLAGGTLANTGKLFVDGATSITTGIANTAGSLIRLQGNSSYSTAVLTAAGGFTNNGGIVLTDSNSSYGATLNVTTGTLTNGPTGTIDAAIGTGGLRTLGVQLDNQGTLTVNRALTLSRASAAHANSGAINIAGGNLTISQSGTLPSFTNTGSMTIGAGDSVKFSSGAFSYAGGSISGGTLSLVSTTVTAAQSFSTATAALNLISSNWGGSGTLTIASGTTVAWRSSAISAPLVNQGTFVVNGASAFNGPVSNAAGATLELQGNSSFSTAVLTVANNFTNSGAIVLTDSNSSYGATLTMPVGTRLTNGPGGSIDAAVGTGGLRTLTVELDNQGLLTLNRSLTLNGSSAAHANSGTINLVSGNLSINQAGASPSFTNTGTITMAGGDSVKVSSGTLNLTSGGLSGGTLSLTSATVNAAQSFSTATAALSLGTSTWGGTGTLTIAPSTSVFWRSSVISAPLVNQGTLVVNGSSAFNGPVTNASGATLRPEGNSSSSTANLTVANSFTNNGAIVLTDINSSYGATITMPAGATLTNAAGATIASAVGTGGLRTLALELDNQGTVTLSRPLALSRNGASHLNSGTIDALGGTLTIGGSTPTFTNTGAINIAAGDSVKMSSGSFNYTSGSISGGGTFALTSATVTAAQNFSTATAALSLVSSTWGGTGTLTIAPATSLLVRASTINSALINQGTLIANGASAFNGTLANATGATLRIEGNSSYSTGSLSVANGFTNDGTVELTDANSSYGAILGVSAGTLTNAPGGSITALTGTNGQRTINAQLDNQGTITVATASNQALTISRSGAAHQNTGTIALTGGDLVVTQFGTSPSFTNNGAISVAAGDTFRVTNGAFTHNTGTISGAGALSLQSVTAGAFNVAHSIGSMLLTTSTVSFATAQNTGATGFVFSGSVINGSGSLTNDTGKTLTVRSTIMNLPVDNQGTMIVNGSSAFNGGLTTGSGSLVRVQGNGTASTATMNVASGFTNNGAIELTDSTSSYGAILNVANGKLINAPGASISALAGANGGRNIGAALDNQGTITVAVGANNALTLSKLDSTHQNSGTIDVTSGDFLVTQSALGGFTNTGAIKIAGADTMTVSGGAFTHSSGTLDGAGALVLSNDSATFTVAHTVAAMKVTSGSVTFATPQSTGTTGFSFDGTTIRGPGSLTNDAGKTLGIRSTTVKTAVNNLGTLLVTGTSAFTDTLTTATGSLLRLQGNGNASTATLTMAKGFENHGAIQLTDTTSAYGARLTVAAGGTLINATGATIDVLAGSNGPRTLDAALDNQGSLGVALNSTQTLIMTAPAGAAMSNSGSLGVNGGDLRITQSGGTLTSIGAITIGGPDTLTIDGGGFDYVGGSLDGPGTLRLLNVSPANFAKPHTLGSIILDGSAAGFTSDQSTANTSFFLDNNASLSGPGTLTNASGKTLKIRSGHIAAPFVNQGLFIATGTSTIDGALSTVAGSTLRVQGNGNASTGTLTVSNGLINNGALELTDSTSSYGATLVVKTLPLVNAPGGTIDIQPGANGPRTIDATIDNQGTFTGSQPVTINHPNAVHTNRGTFKVKGGTITFAQSGGNPSFTNQVGGLIDLDPSTVFRVTGGTMTNDLGGKIVGFGTVDVRALAGLSNNGELIPGGSPGTLTIDGNLQMPTTGSLTIEAGGPTPDKDYDQLVVTGSATLAEATLTMTLLPALPDPKGLTFDIVRFGSGSGAFRTFTVPLGCNQPSLAPDGKGIQVICP